MADLLPEFEQQFATVTADITAKICHLSSKDGEERRNLPAEVEKLVEEAKELLESMELEVREADLSQRERLRNRVKSYQVELTRLEGEYSRVRNSKSEASLRSELFESSGAGAGLSNGEEQRQTLLDNTQKLERTGNRLSQGVKVALETEEIGAQILNDLHSQRQTLNRARGRLHDTDADLDQSSRVLNTMIRRALQNKFVLYVVGGIIVFVILIAIYIGITRG